jgi:hypothetical protein
MTNRTLNPPTLLAAVTALLLVGCHEEDLPTSPALAPDAPAFAHAAAHCLVTDAGDAGPGTLRALIADAGCATISFDVLGEITLTSGELTIDRNLSIYGPGADQLSVRAEQPEVEADRFRVFSVASGTTATIAGLTIRGGEPFGRVGRGAGGGVLNGGALTLEGSVVMENRAAEGGGIYNNDTSTLTVIRSTVHDNVADFGGGILSHGSLRLEHATVSRNEDLSGWAGGIVSVGESLILEHSTVSENIGVSAGGVQSWSYGNLTFRNTILAGNTRWNGSESDLVGFVFSTIAATHTLIGSAEGHQIAGGQDGNIVGVAAAELGLGPLQLNAPGTTPTHALLPGSPAIDHIPNGTVGCGSEFTTDQRGVAMPQGPGCDIGAFELEFEGGDEVDHGSRRLLPPLDDQGFNTVRAGQVVPLKWELLDADGVPVTDLAGVTLTSVEVACVEGGEDLDDGDPVDEPAVGASGLQNLGDGLYQYNWRTNRSYRGTCREVQLDLDGGGVLKVLFSFIR